MEDVTILKTEGETSAALFLLPVLNLPDVGP